MIFNIGKNAGEPITLIRPDVVPGGKADCEYPILAIYDGVHYESVYPASWRDREITKIIVQEIIKNNGCCEGLKTAIEGKLKDFENEGISETRAEEELPSKEAETLCLVANDQGSCEVEENTFEVTIIYIVCK